MFVIDDATGQIQKVKQINIVPIWGIFLYREMEDTTKIDGQCPLFFVSENDLNEFKNSSAGKADYSCWKKMILL